VARGLVRASLASPFNWIYKADILARDVHWYEKNVMGTGPFLFGEYVKGSHWIGRRNPSYWDKGKPYLDGYRAIFVRESATQVAAIRGQRAMIQFRGFSPPERDTLVQALGSQITVQESPWECWNPLAINPREEAVRRPARAPCAEPGARPLSGGGGARATHHPPRGVRRAGRGHAVRGVPGRARGAGEATGATSRRRARGAALLREAGVPDWFGFTFKNRGIPNPYEALGVWLADQWRQIGLNVKIETLELGHSTATSAPGRFEVAADFHCSYIVEPDLALFKFQSTDLSPVNYSRYVDRRSTRCTKSRAGPPTARSAGATIRDFEKRLLDEEAHYIYTLQWHRIVPHSARVRGWTITPSHFLNNQLDTVWLGGVGDLLTGGVSFRASSPRCSDERNTI
jgi:peptide/nickel transport system substrate-binding protein